MGAKESATGHQQPRDGQRAWQIAAWVLALAAASFGCNPITTLGFLVVPFFPDNTDPACPLTLSDKESKVAIICAHTDVFASDPAFRDADQTLSRQLAAVLLQRFKENKEKVTFVPATKVQSFLKSRPNWLAQSKQELGKQLDANYLVYLELGPMTMMEQGSIGTLYRGNAQIHVSVFDLRLPDGDSIKFDNPYTCTFPTTHPEDSTSMPAANFRARFLDRMARDLAHYFASFPAKDKIGSN